jgi:hypothetical protein
MMAPWSGRRVAGRLDGAFAMAMRVCDSPGVILKLCGRNRCTVNVNEITAERLTTTADGSRRR